MFHPNEIISPYPGCANRIRPVIMRKMISERGFSLEEKGKSTYTEKEKKLLQLIRELKFGEIRICVADGQPVRAEEIKRSVKF